jgi:hypothetical protein
MGPLFSATTQSNSQEHPMTALRQRMIDDMQLRNLAPATKETIHHVALSPATIDQPENDLEDIRQFHLYQRPEIFAEVATRGVREVSLHETWKCRSDEHPARAASNKQSAVSSGRSCSVF